MGNEALRASRSSTFRRSSRSRRSQKSSSGGGGGGGQQYVAEDEVDPGAAVAAIDLTPKPTRRMDKIRRSLSFRRKKKSSSEHNFQQAGGAAASSGTQTVGRSGKLESTSMKKSSSDMPTIAATSSTTGGVVSSGGGGAPTTTSPVTTTNTISGTTATSTATATTNTANGDAGAAQVTRPALWIEDEKKVRAGNCSFQVKYLGFQEVSDSRGMHICEQALEKLISLDRDRKKPIKAILYVSGDSLRVVDESNKTLLVDQTIEKVSFCAPDRHHEAGFAYICRDGTSRRWLCHGFLAVKDTLKQATPGATGGERLSHAVGCAFSVCLEKKQKRERENVSMEHGPMHSFARLGSFRQASLTERFDDPQAVMPKAEPVPIKSVDNPHAIERPKPSADAFRRGEAGRGTMLMQPGGAAAAAFNRRNQAGYASLKPGELPSFQQQREKSGFGTPTTPTNNSSTTTTTTTTTTPTTLAETKTALLAGAKQQQYQNMTLAQLANGLDVTPGGVSKSDTFNKLNTISAIPEENLLESSPPSALGPTSSSSAYALTSPLQPTPAPLPIPTPPAPTTTSNVDTQLVNQMTTTLNIEPPPEWSQPAVTALPQPVAATTLAAQAQFFNATTTTPSIFATPQSLASGTPMGGVLGVTTSALHGTSVNPVTPPLPPPLPHMPGVYQAPIYPSSAMVTTPSATASASIYLTSPSAASLGSMITPNSMITPATPVAIGGAAPQGTETFEQKWARYQATKKQTNPFAEDIAKKYEIKL